MRTLLTRNPTTDSVIASTIKAIDAVTCPECERKKCLKKSNRQFTIVFSVKDSIILSIGLSSMSMRSTDLETSVPVMLKDIVNSIRFIVLLNVMTGSRTLARGFPDPHRCIITKAVVGVAVEVMVLRTTVVGKDSILGTRKRRLTSVVLISKAVIIVRTTLTIAVVPLQSPSRDKWNLPLTEKVTKFSVTLDRTLQVLTLLTLRKFTLKWFSRQGLTRTLVIKQVAIVGSPISPVK